MQRYTLTTLDGGGRVITERLPSVRSVAIGIWIDAGSRDEDDAHAGLSHFLEHLLFKGTKTYSALEIAEIFDGFGGELNASTGRDYTVVYGRVLDAHLDEAMDVMTDMVFAPSLSDLETEREVVLEEIAMVEDTPQELVHDLVTETVFGDHPLGRPVLGSAEVIANVSRRSVGAYHRSRYRPDNVVVAAAGSLDHDHVVELVRAKRGQGGRPAGAKACRSAALRGARRSRASTSGGRTRSSTTSASPHPGSRGRTGGASRPRSSTRCSAARRRRGSSRRSARSAGWPTPSTRSPRSTRTPARSASTWERARRTSRSAWRSSPSRSTRSRQAACGPEELERAKENLKGRVMLSMELTSNRMSRLGKSLVTDSELLDLDRVIAEIDAVDADAVAGLAGILLAPERLSVAAIGPNEERFLAAAERISPDLVGAAAAA